MIYTNAYVHAYENYQLKIYTTLGYIVSLILLNLGHVFRFRIVSRFNYKMFHQEASVETIKSKIISDKN